jgi:hypothetical protein
MEHALGPGLAFDDDLGDATARQVRELLAAGRIGEAQTRLAGIRHWDARLFYIDSASRWPGRPGWLDQWVAAGPNPALALLVRGDHAIYWAWEARGTGWEPAAGSEALFEQRLTLAETDLQHAAELDPEDPSALCLRLRVARGRRLSLSEKFERFQELCRRDPRHRRGHTEMLRALSQKWGGSHQVMFQFARDTAAKAPPGSPLHTVIVEAHVERWLVADRDGVDNGYWRRTDVAAEVTNAAAAYFQAAEFRPTPVTVVDRSYFAFAFSEMGDLAAARTQFEAMTLPFRWPWAMFGDPAQLIASARSRALAGR